MLELWSEGEEVVEKVVVPACFEPFGVDAALTAPIQTDQVECDAAENRQILGGVPDTDAALVLMKGIIQPPMLLILNPLRATYSHGNRIDGAIQTTQVIARHAASPAGGGALTDDHRDTAQIRSSVATGVEVDDQVRIRRDKAIMRHDAPLRADRLGEEGLDRVVGGGLVAFERADIVAATSPDVAGGGGLALHGIQRHDAPRTSRRAKRAGTAGVSLDWSSTAT